MAVANIHLEKKEYSMALKFYKAAYELDNSLEYINLFLAATYYKLGKKAESYQYLKKALEEDEESINLFLEICPEAAVHPTN
jgi:predicted Zn-dependent protease